VPASSLPCRGQQLDTTHVPGMGGGVSEDDDVEQSQIASAREEGLGRRADPYALHELPARQDVVPADREAHAIDAIRPCGRDEEREPVRQRWHPPSAQRGGCQPREGRPERQDELPGSEPRREVT
jgi:hypothetical protein